MYKIFFIVLLIFSSSIFSQVNFKQASGTPLVSYNKLNSSEIIPKDVFSANKIYGLKNHVLVKDSNTVSNKTSVGKLSKSPGLAFIYSLFIPVMGQLYAMRFDVAK